MMIKVLLVDDEALARSRLRTLLSECIEPAVSVLGEAANATEAMECLRRQQFDAVLLDIHMPGADGLTLAKTLEGMRNAPAVIFVTAHAEHAVQAFEVEAVDYLTKPVRAARLQQALQKVERYLQSEKGLQSDLTENFLIISERGRTLRVALQDVLYFKAELKYITVRTLARNYLLDGSISELEEKYAAHFMRIHRNALVARRSVRSLEKHFDAEEGEGWAVRLSGIDELLAVSRRQLTYVREAISAL